MTPSQFKERYIGSLPDVPEELKEELDLERFVTFPSDRVVDLAISSADRAILVDVGLPADAAPFLNFDLDAKRQLAPLERHPRMVALGTNAYGYNQTKDRQAFLEALASIDAGAVATGTFWFTESQQAEPAE